MSCCSSLTQTLAQHGAVHDVSFTAADRFCIGNVLLVAVAGAYGADGSEYRTEVDSFARIFSRGTVGSGPAFFEGFSRTGDVTVWGNSSDSRVLVSAASARCKVVGEVNTWAMTR
jgi:hypothetical protein